MSAPATRLADAAVRGESLDRRRRCRPAVREQRAAVTVVGVLAQAGVGDQHEVEVRVARIRRRRLLDDPVVDPAAGPDGRPCRPAGRTGCTPPTPSAAEPPASATATSGDIRSTPGIESIGSRTPEPGWTKSGATSIRRVDARLADERAERRRAARSGAGGAGPTTTSG